MNKTTKQDNHSEKFHVDIIHFNSHLRTIIINSSLHSSKAMSKSGESTFAKGEVNIPKDLYDPEERRKDVFARLDKALKEIEKFAEELFRQAKNKPQEDVTTKALRIIQSMVKDLECDVEKFKGPHFTKEYRTLQGHCTKLQTDLDALDFSGRDTLRDEKKGAVLTISNLAKELAKKTHQDGKSCQEGCEI